MTKNDVLCLFLGISGAALILVQLIIYDWDFTEMIFKKEDEQRAVHFIKRFKNY